MTQSEMSETIEFRFKHDWLPLASKAGEKYPYPGPVRNYLPGRKDGPGIYRWSFYSPGDSSKGLCQVLIGQTESLLRRLGEYSRPTTKEESAWQIYFLDQIGKGFRVECHLLQFDKISVNGVLLTQDELVFPFVRVFLENLMLIIHSSDKGCRILNKGKDLRDKRVDRVLKELKRLGVTPEQVQRSLNINKS